MAPFWWFGVPPILGHFRFWQTWDEWVLLALMEHLHRKPSIFPIQITQGFLVTFPETSPLNYPVSTSQKKSMSQCSSEKPSSVNKPPSSTTSNETMDNSMNIIDSPLRSWGFPVFFSLKPNHWLNGLWKIPTWSFPEIGGPQWSSIFFWIFPNKTIQLLG